jgi:hypothetical protein
MRLYRFEADGRPQLGAEQAGELIDLAAAHAARGAAAGTLPTDIVAFIRAGTLALTAAEALAFAA